MFQTVVPPSTVDHAPASVRQWCTRGGVYRGLAGSVLHVRIQCLILDTELELSLSLELVSGLVLELVSELVLELVSDLRILDMGLRPRNPGYGTQTSD